MTKNIAIVGAGVIGVSCALELLEAGHQVTLYDRSLPGRSGPSKGNAAHIASSEIIPLASPGIALKAMKMLTDPRAPLKVPVSQWLRLAPWLLRFLSNAKQTCFERNIAATAAFNKTVEADIERLFRLANISHLLQQDGALYLFESDISLQRSRAQFVVRNQHGYANEEISADQVAELEPALGHHFSGGYLLPQWLTVSDPYKVVTGLAEAVTGKGGRLIVDQVESVLPETSLSKARVIHSNGQQRLFDTVIVSAGAWSNQILKASGDKQPLEAERGYNITYQNPGFRLRRAVLFADRGIVATPLDHGIRIGGWAELGGLRRPANPDYFATLDQIAQELFPDLQTDDHYPWMGHRPSTPDSQPIVRQADNSQHIIYAFGHGHLGLTQSATTARKVAELV